MNNFARCAVSGIVHTIVGAGLTGTATALFFGAIYLAFSANPADAFFAAIFFGFLASLAGGFLGFLIWGARGWISGFKSARAGWQDYRDDGAVNGSVPAHRPFYA